MFWVKCTTGMDACMTKLPWGRSFCSQIPTWREDENAIRFRQTCRGPSRLRIDARIAAPLSSKLAYDLGRGLRETWVVASAAHRTWPRTSTPKAASVFSLSHLARCAGSERTGQRSQNCPFFARRQLGVGDHATIPMARNREQNRNQETRMLYVIYFLCLLG